MSDIGPDWGPLDIAAIALTIGAPGLVIGVALGAILWRAIALMGRCSAPPPASCCGLPALRLGRRAVELRTETRRALFRYIEFMCRGGESQTGILKGPITTARSRRAHAPAYRPLAEIISESPLRKIRRLGALEPPRTGLLLQCHTCRGSQSEMVRFASQFLWCALNHSASFRRDSITAHPFFAFQATPFG